IFDGKYKVQRLLGQGGFGAVYLVRNEEVDWLLALKLLHPDISGSELFRKRFVREMNLAHDLIHENSVPVRDAGVADGRLFYTMDFVEGRTMAEVIASEGRIEPARAVGWILALLKFLEFLHGKGYLHRDLKPANLMIEATEGGERVRVLD